MPTGTGKTVLFASIIKAIQPGRTLVVAHRSELIWQAKEKIERVTGLVSEVEMGEFRSSIDGTLFSPNAQVIVATVQTLTSGGDGMGRMSKFTPTDIDLLIVDEAAHAASDSYKRMLDYFLKNPKLKVFFCSATPDRADRKALGDVFESVAFDYQTSDAIHDGWILPVQQQMVNVEGLDFSSIKTTAGDLNQGELAEVLEAESSLHGIVSSTIDIIGSKRGIGFATSVRQAQMMAEIFNRHKSGMASFVSGTTPKDERALLLKQFANGEIQVMLNCGVLTEGFDDSGVEFVVMKPTKSRALYAQMLGRAMRVHDSIASTLASCPAASVRRAMIARSCKPSMLAIDHFGVSGKHKLVCSADILGGKYSNEAVEMVMKKARKSGKPIMMEQSIEEAEKRIQLKRQKQLEEQARKANIVIRAKYNSKEVDPFSLLDIRPYEPSQQDKRKLTPKMQGILRKAGFDPAEFSYRNGRQLVITLLDRWKNHLCTVGQLKILKQHNAGNEKTKFEDAGLIIDAIAKNKWKGLPAGFQLPKPDIQSSEVPF